MDHDTLIAGLKTHTLGYPLYLFDRIESTNVFALRLGRFGASEGTLVVADYQMAGRGRRARRWFAPPGSSILASLILRPSDSSSQRMLATGSETWYTSWYTLLAALAIAEGIEQQTSLRTEIKWPNDVWIAGKKVCGILTEWDRDMRGQPYCVIGFGVNVNFPRAALPLPIRQTATALNWLLGFDVSRETLLQRILQELEVRIQEFRHQGVEHLRWELHRRSLVLYRRVRAHTPEGTVEGEACGFERDGSLLIRQDDQRIVQIHAGEVHLTGDF